MTNRETAIEYLDRFSAADIEGIASLLAEEFSFSGPLYEFSTKIAYLDCLRSDPPTECDLKVVSITESNDEVAIFYEYAGTRGPLNVAQRFRIKDNLIHETHLVFDTAAKALQ